jgi:hypothetical protein
VYVRVCDRLHPLLVIDPSAEVIVGVPQLSVAIAVPAAGTPDGLQPRSEPAGHEVNTGGVVSSTQVKVWVQVAVLPQPSVAVYVRVCDRLHPLLVIDPSAEVIVGVPQLSVAVAVPAAGTPDGLQPRSEPAGHEVNTGGVASSTLTVSLQVIPGFGQSVHVTLSVIVNVAPHVLPAVTLTVEPVEDPTIVPLPVMLQ